MTQKPFAAGDPAISMNYLGSVFRTLRKDGYEVETLLAGTGLTAEQLEDPDFRCDFWSNCRFYVFFRARSRYDSFLKSHQALNE